MRFEYPVIYSPPKSQNIKVQVLVFARKACYNILKNHMKFEYPVISSTFKAFYALNVRLRTL